MGAPYRRIEPPISEYSLVCRGCLADSGEMKNIREWGMVDDFCQVTNVQLNDTDGISELLCTSCEDALVMCKRFRTQCQQSDVTLKNVAQNENIIMEEEQNTITSTLTDSCLNFRITAPVMTEKIYLPCPFKCNGVHFIKKKDLLPHLIKKHSMDKSFTIDTKYYCHIVNCNFHVDGTKSFTERKFLNQHFNKVHRNKEYHCQSCDNDFPTAGDFNRHIKTCNLLFNCDICNIQYKTDERLLVHLMRHHPSLHEEYKQAKKAEKRKLKSDTEAKKLKTDTINNINEYLMDSPKRSFATQTLDPQNTVKNDVTLPSWQTQSKTDEISTQTVFEDLLSLKSQNSEDEMFFSETVSLSDIQTQTFPECGLSRSHKETITDNNVDLSIKGTQTCVCYCDSPKSFTRLCESVSSSPSSNNFTSTETQTADFKSNVKSDVLLSFSSAETQTCFEESGL